MQRPVEFYQIMKSNPKLLYQIMTQDPVNVAKDLLNSGRNFSDMQRNALEIIVRNDKNEGEKLASNYLDQIGSTKENAMQNIRRNINNNMPF